MFGLDNGVAAAISLLALSGGRSRKQRRPLTPQERKEHLARQEYQAILKEKRPRIGRNDPCLCGSGKKFKNCHLNKPIEPVKEETHVVDERALSDLSDAGILVQPADRSANPGSFIILTDAHGEQRCLRAAYSAEGDQCVSPGERVGSSDRELTIGQSSPAAV